MMRDISYLEYMKFKRQAELSDLTNRYNYKHPVGSIFTTYSGDTRIAIHWEVRGIVDHMFVCRSEFPIHSGQYNYKTFAVHEFPELEKDNRIIKGWHDYHP